MQVMGCGLCELGHALPGWLAPCWIVGALVPHVEKIRLCHCPCRHWWTEDGSCNNGNVGVLGRGTSRGCHGRPMILFVLVFRALTLLFPQVLEGCDCSRIRQKELRMQTALDVFVMHA